MVIEFDIISNLFPEDLFSEEGWNKRWNDFIMWILLTSGIYKLALW